MNNTISNLFEKYYYGLAFNTHSTYVDYKEQHLYYSDPIATFDFCKKSLMPFVTLKHDYTTKPNGYPYEFFKDAVT